MPLKNGNLTPAETRFVAKFGETGDRAKAAKHAGISQSGSYAILARPEIQRRIVAQQSARLTADALPIAVATLIEIMQSSKAPASARVQASKVVLDRAMPTGEDGRPKDLHELTPEEIAASIAALERAASDIAKDVTPPKGDIFE